MTSGTAPPLAPALTPLFEHGRKPAIPRGDADGRGGGAASGLQDTSGERARAARPALGFVLWDGSTVPADLAPDAFAVAFADEGAIAGLVRRPSLDTLANLWVSRRIDIRNGTLFDLANARPRKKVRTRDFLKNVDKGAPRARAASSGASTAAGRGRWRRSRPRALSGDPSENKQNIAYHYDVSNAFYALWLDKEMVYTCAYCTDWKNDIDQMQQDKLEMICRKLRLKPGETCSTSAAAGARYRSTRRSNTESPPTGRRCPSSRSTTPRRRSSGSASRTR